MRGSSQGSTGTGRRCMVADTAAFLAGTYLHAEGRVYTVPEVIGEVLDEHSRHLLELGVQAGKVFVEEPSREALRASKRYAVKARVQRLLSETDVRILALAIHLRDTGICEPVLATDDYKLQRAAAAAGVTYRPVKTPGLSGLAKHK